MRRRRRRSTGLSLRQYAARRGVSVEAVSKAVRSGRISVDKNGRILDPARADAEWAANTRPSAPRTPAFDDAPATARNGHGDFESSAAFLKARAVREHLLARRLKLDLEREEGLLVLSAEVRAAENAVMSQVREILRTSPIRTAPSLVGVSLEEARAILEGEWDRILVEFQKLGDLARRPSDGGRAT